MGSPISRFLPEVLIQTMDSIVMPRIQPNPWAKYADVTFATIEFAIIEEKE